MKRFSIQLLVMAGLLAFAVTPAVQAKGLALSFAPKPGDTLTYKMTMKMDMDMSMPGMATGAMSGSQKMATITEAQFTQKVIKKNEDGNFEIKVTYDTFDMTMEMAGQKVPMPGHAVDFAGKEFTSVMNPEGEILKMDMTELGLATEMKIKELYSNSTLNVPNKEVEIGATWTDSQVVEMPMGFGQAMNQSIAVQNTLKGFEKWNGKDVAKIHQDFLIEQAMKPTDEQGGMLEDLAKKEEAESGRSSDAMKDLMQNMQQKISGAGTGTALWDVTREIPVKQSSKIAMEIKQSMPNPAAGMAMPASGENGEAQAPAMKSLEILIKATVTTELELVPTKVAAAKTVK